MASIGHITTISMGGQMKAKLYSLLFAALLAGPLSANATPVDWAIHGEFTFLNGSQAATFPIQPGDLYSFVMHFDPATLGGFCFANGGGTACRYNNPGLSYSAGNFGGINLGDVSFDGGAFVDVYDNADSPLQGLAGPVDGYMFRGFNSDDDGNAQKWSVYLLSSDTSYFSGQPGLPSVEPSLQGLTAYFRFCKSDGPQGTGCELILLQGPLANDARVPEPGNFALLTLGFAGLLLSRRRRH